MTKSAYAINFKRCAYCQEDKRMKDSLFCSVKCEILFQEHMSWFWNHYIIERFYEPYKPPRRKAHHV